MPVNQRQRPKKSEIAGKSNNTNDSGGGHTHGPPASRPNQGQQPSPPSFFARFARRMAIMVFMGIIVYYLSNKDQHVPLAKYSEVISRTSFKVPCSDDYARESEKWMSCVPKRCGRVIMDNVVASQDVDKLLSIAKKGLAFGGSSGGASILDLHSGALSMGSSFINIYRLNESKTLFSDEDFNVYRRVKNAIQLRIGMEFGVLPQNMYLTHPTFFSWITKKPAKTVHDEYWHPHIDKETYESFHYTSLLYLGTYNEDFQGGRFVFVDKQSNKTVEPRKGRLSMFTSGSENLHYVEKVTAGDRYAITVSFTCDIKYAITDPSLDRLQS